MVSTLGCVAARGYSSARRRHRRSRFIARILVKSPAPLAPESAEIFHEVAQYRQRLWRSVGFAKIGFGVQLHMVLEAPERPRRSQRAGQPAFRQSGVDPVFVDTSTLDSEVFDMAEKTGPVHAGV